MIILLTTVPKKSDALSLAKKLVGKKLAACVNIIKIESSVFRWKGKLANAREFLLIIKTARNYRAIESFIKINHPYELPEIISLKVENGLKQYLKWIADSG